jgi:hypothetical protein
MSDDIAVDVKSSLDALKKAAEIHDMGPAMQSIHLHIQEHLQNDPNYESKFVKELSKKMEEEGVLPGLVVEYAKESFPVIGTKAWFTGVTGGQLKPESYIVYRNDLQMLLVPGADTRHYQLPGYASPVSATLMRPDLNPITGIRNGQVPAPPIDRIFLGVLDKNFNQINKYAPFRRQVFRDVINVTDIENYLHSQK